MDFIVDKIYCFLPNFLQADFLFKPDVTVGDLNI